VIREAAALERCRWEVETLSNEDLNRGHIDGANTNVVRVAWPVGPGGNARAGPRVARALDDLFAGLTLAHRIGDETAS